MLKYKITVMNTVNIIVSTHQHVINVIVRMLAWSQHANMLQATLCLSRAWQRCKCDCRFLVLLKFA